MPKENKTLKAHFNGFEGIDTRKNHSGKESIKDIVNFRIKDDASLEKRWGFTSVYRSSTLIRGVWSGNIHGEFVCYILDGPYVIRLDFEEDKSYTVGKINQSSGNVYFFYYMDCLYLSDNKWLYRIDDSGVNAIVGYVPLYGKEWKTTYPGEVNEPLNLFNRYARITYRATEDHTNMLATSRAVSEIYSIYKNGELLSPDSYNYDANLMAIAISSIDPGDFFEVSLCFAEELPDSKIYESSHATVFGGAHNSRLFLWGSSEGNLVFVNRLVPQKDLDAAQSRFPGCGSLYFPEGSGFFVGNNKNKITAMLRHFDRLLIFSDSDTWVADSRDCDSEDIPTMKINTSIGCIATNGAVMGHGNKPVTIGVNSIHYWTSETDRLEECNALTLSDEINGILNTEFFKNAIIFKDDFREEIWIHQVGSTENTWIYNLKQNKWVRFTNIDATMLFATNDDVGFVSKNTQVLKFTKGNYKDQYSGYNKPSITATFKAGILDFDCETQKRLSSLGIKADLDGGSLLVDIETDQGKHITKTITSNDSMHDHYTSKRRLHSDKFSHLNEISITASGENCQTIHRFELCAKQLDK